MDIKGESTQTHVYDNGLPFLSGDGDGVFYPEGQSLRGAFYPAGQSLRLTSPYKITK